MSAYKYKIGDFVKIIKLKHYCFGNVGRVLKINKSTLIVGGDENCDDEVVTIAKKYVELQDRPLPELKLVSLTKGGRKKESLDYYMKKAFLPEDFEDFVLFNYMRPFTGRAMKRISKADLLTKKIRENKILGSSHKSCVFFTPIPVKFFKKYFSEELIQHYSTPKTDIFICLDSNVLCNMPKNYWIGINADWNQGPNNLIHSYRPRNIFYALDSCSTKPELNKSFLDFFMEQVADRFKDKYLQLLENDIGLTVYLESKNEDKFINFLRNRGKELFLGGKGTTGMELFACPAGWVEVVKTVLRFKKEDVLIANYERDTVEENINRVLEL
jgi:hypothetical protein